MPETEFLLETRFLLLAHMPPDTRLLRYAGARAWLAAAIGLGLAAGILLILQASLLSNAIAAVFLGDAELETALPRLLGFLTLGLLRAAAMWGGEAAAGRAANRIKHPLRLALTRHLLALGPRFTAGERGGELTNTITGGVDALDAYIRGYLPQLALAALVPLAILVVIFPLDPLSGVVFLLTAPLIPLFMILIGDLAGQRSRRQWRTLSRLSAVFLDVLQGLSTLKLLNRSRQQLALIQTISDRFRQSTMDVLRVAFLSALVLEMLATVSVAVVAVEIGLRLLRGGLPFVEALFILVLAPDFYQPLRLLGARFHAGTAGTVAAERIFALLAIPTPRAGSAVPPPGPTEIRLENVTVAYPDRPAPALDGVSLALRAGRQLALVGPSGAGKSTVAALLLGFVRPTAGRVTVNGVDLASLDPAAWRTQVAWVPQRPTLFNESLAINIWRARPNAPWAAVLAAARLARVDDFVDDLPGGYEALVGERGVRLSGGQAQRVALARAFLKDAPILILDEATSHLDAIVEAELHAIVARLTEERTVLTISHQLGAARAADEVAVLADGRIANTGPYEGLAACEEPFRRRQSAGDEVSTLPAKAADLPAQTAPWPPTMLAAETPVANRAETLHRLLRLVWPVRGRMALAALLGFATVGSGIALISTAGFIISKAALRPSIAALQLAIVSVRFFGISRGGFRYLERLVSHDTTFRLLARLRLWFYEAIEPLAPARLSRRDSGDLLARVVSDIDALENFFVRAIAPPLVALLVMGGVGLALGRLSPPLALAVLAYLALAGTGVPLLSAWLNRRAGAEMAHVRGRLTSALVDTVQGVADLLVLGQEEHQLARVAGLSRRLGDLQEHMARVAGLQAAIVTSLAQAAAVSGLILAVPLVSAGVLDGVLLAAIALGILAAFEAVMPLPEALGQLEASLAAAARLFELADASPAVTDPAHPAPPPETFDLRIRDLTFAYEPGAVPVLADLSLDVPAQGRVAIVGPSGAGKSTLANLLLRFYPIQAGEILLGDRPIQACRQEDVRRAISVVSQQTHLFAGTVSDNLRLARPRATTAELEAALAQAQLFELVASLPQGLETWIGDGGVRLSGGERQRLAIARALLRDAPVLMLDEATANLDLATEQALLATLEVLMRGRTTLVITHRLALAARMDEILVLRRGRIVQRGTHAALLAEDGLYRHMWTLQQAAV